jgi:hypothetical protein
MGTNYIHPILTVSIEMDPPSNPSTGKLIGSIFPQTACLLQIENPESALRTSFAYRRIK